MSTAKGKELSDFYSPVAWLTLLTLGKDFGLAFQIGDYQPLQVLVGRLLP